MRHRVGLASLCTVLAVASALLIVGGPTESAAADEDKNVEQLIVQGKTDELAALLKKKPELAKSPHKLLHDAARRGRTTIVQLLLDHGADPNLDYVISNIAKPYTPLSEAITAGHLECARLLCKHGADVKASADKSYDRLLPYAVAWREPRFGNLLLEQKADVNERDRFGLTPLHIAADLGDIAKGRLLLDFKADVNAETEDGATPLFFAMVRGHPDFCRFLREHGARLDMHTACGLGLRHEVAAFLKGNPTLANIPDRRLGRTPLFWAVRNGDPELVKSLLARGASVNVRAPSIIVWGNVVAGPDVFEKQLPPGRGVTPLHVAAESESTEAVRLLLANGADPNARDEDGRSPLLRALLHQHAAIVKLLVKAGADVNAKTDAGLLPLCEAVGDRACVETLLNGGAKVNAVDKERGTAMLLAAYEGHKEVADLLLAAGAKLDFQSACLLGRVRDVERFLKADPRLVDATAPFSHYSDETPLVLAARAGQVEVFDLLIAHGADPNPSKSRYRSALHVAARCGNQAIVERLLAKGVPIDSHTGGEKITALFDAVMFAQPEMVRFLLKHKADPRVRASSFTPARGTPLHCVGAMRLALGLQEGEGGPDVLQREVAVARLLLDAGADLEARDDFGETPLHHAAWLGNADLVALLLARGAQVNARDKDYDTPLHNIDDGHSSRRPGHEKIVELLRKNGGTE
jgi:ankyrin repeat protein